MIPFSFGLGWFCNDTWNSILEAYNSFDEPISAEVSDQPDPNRTSEISTEGLSHSGLVKEVIRGARISAYTTRPEEGTTCVSASGLNLCAHYPPDFFNEFTIGDCSFGGYGLIACPEKYPFGATIKIDGHERDYVCVDRMAASRQDQPHFDIYFGDDVEGANSFGIKYLDIEVLK